MVGFPQETDEDFETTKSFAKKVGFEKVHIFPYSRRSGTVADKMDGQIEKAVKAQRVTELSMVADKIRNEFLVKQVGKTVSVLIEAENKNGFCEGYTANYTPVKVKGNFTVGEIIKAKITRVENDYCISE
jgi:threonylcarbamoyladenosine tRNA methylthiotransferase MtaB